MTITQYMRSIYDFNESVEIVRRGDSQRETVDEAFQVRQDMSESGFPGDHIIPHIKSIWYLTLNLQTQNLESGDQIVDSSGDTWIICNKNIIKELQLVRFRTIHEILQPSSDDLIDVLRVLSLNGDIDDAVNNESVAVYSQISGIKATKNVILSSDKPRNLNNGVETVKIFVPKTAAIRISDVLSLSDGTFYAVTAITQISLSPQWQLLTGERTLGNDGKPISPHSSTD